MKKAIQSLEEVRKTSADFSINAEMFTPDIVELRNKLRSNGYKPLAEFAKYIKRGSQPEYSTDGTIKALRSVNIRENGFSNDRQEFVTEDFYNKNPRMHIFKGDVLLNSTGVGTLGRCCFVFNNEKFVIDGHITRISKLEELSPEFLYVYLNSKYGQLQINKLYKGSSGQIEIYPEQIQLIYVKPLKMQKLISNLVQLSYQYREKCIQYYKEANSYLKNELTLDSEYLSHKLWSVKNYSDVKDANRFDAEYFQPKYDEIINILTKNGYTRLIDNFDIVRNSGLEYHEDGKFGVIKTKQIKDKFIDFNVESKTNLYEDNVIVKNKDVIFASMGVGSLGKANIYYNFENNNKFVIDSTLKIFRKKINGSISPELLETYLHTQIAQELIYQNVVGSSGIISVYESYLQELPIPIINSSMEQKIVENIKTAHLLNYQSKQLLEIAKRGVEIAIEQDEDIATNWINQELQKIGVEL